MERLCTVLILPINSCYKQNKTQMLQTKIVTGEWSSQQPEAMDVTKSPTGWANTSETPQNENFPLA